jgi:cation:H+ antiporter
MIFALVKLAVGVLLITKGADWFTEAAVKIAEATHVPRVIIGATIVSLATTMPEFTVSTYSALTARADFAVGNAIGSTVCNIGLILGTCLMIRPMLIDRPPLTLQQGLIMIGAGALVTLLGVDGRLSRIDSLPLILGLVGYVYYSMWVAKGERGKALAEMNGERVESDIDLRREALLFIVGAGCVVFGSRWLVNSAELIARKLGVPDLIIGITLVALGTSLPEYVTALTATIKGYQEISVGNIMGADILDIFWVLGGASLFKTLPIQRQTNVLDFPFMLALMIMLTFFARTRNRISRLEGFGLFAVYVIYLAMMFWKFRVS